MKIEFPFDPLKRSEEVERLVMKEGKRLYHRFRGAPYYGGIATADAIGCSFLCAYCWNFFRNLDPSRFEKFDSPLRVAHKLLEIAKKKSFRLFRVTGSEPILGKASFEHLVEVVRIIFSEQPRSIFILETNGFYLGHDVALIEKLKFENLWIRISLKGVDEESFELISGARREYFQYPLIALKELEKQRLRAWPAIMRDLFNEDEISRLERLLEELHIHSRLEEEYLEAYPFVVENMRKRKVPVKN
jgi:uncharacterized Fe-S cluster-containing radical SAM superfamily protein